jgi:uncharacterized 2Fe-2S/4Fe-4S cluster protein (DUF4445 family)
MDVRFTIIFQPSGKRVDINQGQTILEAARLCGVFIPSICGGKGRCGKCRVIIHGRNAVTPPTQAEVDLIGKGASKRIRLACLAVPTKNVTVEIPPESRESVPDILVEGLGYEIDLDPIVTKHYVELDPPSLEDPLADMERLRRAIAETGLEISDEGWSTIQTGPWAMRKSDWRVTAGIWNSQRLIRLQEGDKTGSIFGAAVDVGTTTVVCYLVDLLTGKTVASDSNLNPQIPYGEDVVTRLANASLGTEEAQRLHTLIADEVSRLLTNCCKKAGASLEDVLDVCIVGNTVMHHLALGLPTNYLGVSPFSPVVRKGFNSQAGQIGLTINPDTPVHALPTLAGYVGADTCGVILASRIYEAEDISMAIDIGTNGEIVLGNRDGLTVCSCAAGPAMEGAHIRHGMRAADGAIQRVSIKGEDVSIKTIGGKPPVGIAGAGIIDSVAEMFLSGAIGNDGRFREHPRVRLRGKMKEFVLVEAKGTGIGDDIVMTQRDIREVQLAKAAIYTGASTLLQYAGLSPDDVAVLHVAGAFGNFVEWSKAKAIGLIPDIPIERLKFIGNGAGAGAKLALLSRSLREVSEHIAEKVNYIELTCSANFTGNYMNATYMPHKELERFPSVKLPD